MNKPFRLILALLCLALISCQGQQASTKAPEGDYLVRIGNDKITEADVQNELQTLPLPYREIVMTEEDLKLLLDNMIVKELLYKEAQKEGLDKKPEFIAKMDDFKKMTLAREVLDKSMEKAASMPDAEVRGYYDTHKDEFQVDAENGKGKETIGFDEVKDVLKQRLTFDAYVEELKKSYKIEMNEDAIKKLAASHSEDVLKQHAEEIGEHGAPAVGNAEKPADDTKTGSEATEK